MVPVDIVLDRLRATARWDRLSARDDPSKERTLHAPVDFDLGLIHVTDSKNSESRDIPMNDILRKSLLQLKERTAGDSEFVFVNPKTGKPYDDKKKSYKAALKKAAKGSPSMICGTPSPATW